MNTVCTPTQPSYHLCSCVCWCSGVFVYVFVFVVLLVCMRVLCVCLYYTTCMCVRVHTYAHASTHIYTLAHTYTHTSTIQGADAEYRIRGLDVGTLSQQGQHHLRVPCHMQRRLAILHSNTHVRPPCGGRRAMANHTSRSARGRLTPSHKHT